MRWRWLTPGAVMLVSAVALAACHGGLHCGAVVTEDVVLDADLTNCPGDGLVIGADGITVDLAGHTIDKGPSGPYADSAGIRVAGHDGVEIRGGRVQEFETGVSLVEVRSAFVHDVVAAGNSIGFRLEDSDFNRLSSNRGELSVNTDGRTGHGFLLDGSHGNRLEDNAANLNDYGSGVFLRQSHFNLVAGNNVENNNILDSVAANIHLSGAISNRIERNAVGGNPYAEVLLITSHRNRIAGNVSERPLEEDNGWYLYRSDDNDIVGNQAGPGVTLFGGDRNLLAFNTAEIVSLDGYGDPSTPDPALDNEVVSNRLTIPENLGILVHRGTSGTTVTGNLVTNGASNGISVGSPATSITDNTANDNDGYGINAVAGVTDGGGNTASGNGGPAQCLNVNCA